MALTLASSLVAGTAMAGNAETLFADAHITALHFSQAEFAKNFATSHGISASDLMTVDEDETQVTLTAAVVKELSVADVLNSGAIEAIFSTKKDAEAFASKLLGPSCGKTLIIMSDDGQPEVALNNLEIYKHAHKK